MLENLKRKGWHLQEDVGNQSEKVILNQDIHEIGQQCIENYLKESNENVNCILQISKLKNIAASSKKQDSYSATRMLKITLTDGINSCTGLEIEALKDVTLNTYPGTKVQLTGNVHIVNGYLLLTPANFKVLGGHVDKLFNKWKLAKDLSNHSRNDFKGGDDPPPFIPFGQKVKKSVEIKPKVVQKSVASNSENPEDLEFNKNRNAAIKDVYKEQSLREFSHKSKPMIPVANTGQKYYKSKEKTDASTASNDFVKIEGDQYYRDSYKDNVIVNETFLNDFMQMGFRKSDAINALKTSKNSFDFALDMLTSPPPNNEGRNNQQKMDRQTKYKSRKGGRQSPEMNSEASKPATLFDFLESKIPVTEVETPTARNNMTDARDKQRFNSYASQNSIYNQTDGYSSHRQKPTGQRGNKDKPFFSYDGSKTHLPQYEKQNYKRENGQRNNNNRPKDYKNNNSTETTSNESKNGSAHQNYNTQKSGGNKFKSKKIGEKTEQFYKLSASGEGSKVKTASAGGISQYGPTTFKSADNSNHKTNQLTRANISIGMECVAKYWEDKLYYPAVITDIHPTIETVVVLFTAYGNYEEISFKDIQTNDTNSYQTQSHTVNNRQQRPMKTYYTPPAQRNSKVL